MTIKEMIKKLQELAMESDNGENTIVLSQNADEWGATNIADLYTIGNAVLIIGEKKVALFYDEIWD